VFKQIYSITNLILHISARISISIDLIDLISNLSKKITMTNAPNFFIFQ